MYRRIVVPFVMGLMQRRTTAEYRNVLQVIKNQVRNLTHHRWAPQDVICDFEKALHTALETDLPQTRIRGCYFHFNQSLWRRVQEFGLVRAYRINNRTKKIIRKVMAVGFLPTAIVALNFRALAARRSTQRAIQRYPALRNWLDYVDMTYINPINSFPIPSWNVYDRDMDRNTKKYVIQYIKCLQLLRERSKNNVRFSRANR